MILTANQEGTFVVYKLKMDISERDNANYQPGDREFVHASAKNPLISEKLCALALIAKRIEEGRLVSAALEKAQPAPSQFEPPPAPPIQN